MQRIEFRRKAVGNARTNAVNKLRIKHSAGNIQPISNGANKVVFFGCGIERKALFRMQTQYNIGMTIGLVNE